MKTTIRRATLARLLLAASLSAVASAAVAQPATGDDGSSPRQRARVPAGVYDCAPGAVRTQLARRACGGARFPRRFF